jgi:hypothetical protein
MCARGRTIVGKCRMPARKVAANETVDKREKIVRLNQLWFPPAVAASLQNMEPKAVIFEKMGEEHVRACALQEWQKLISKAI